MTCAIYSRVSTVGKGQDSENQAAQIRTWAAANGHTIYREYSDELSGSGKVRRPAFERMMADAEAHKFEMLLFWSLDRLSREGPLVTLQYLKRLDDAGVCWRSHTEAYLDSCGAFREAVLAILAAIAKQERLRISERVKAGLDRVRADGQKLGRPKKPLDVPRIMRIRRLRAQGYSMLQIANAENITKIMAIRMLQKELPEDSAKAI